VGFKSAREVIDTASMEREDRGILGQILACAGAGVTALSLWQPWYSFRIPTGLLQQAVQHAAQFGILGPSIVSGAQYLQAAGPLHVSSWQVMTGSPALLLGASTIGGTFALLGVTGRARGVGRVSAWCGFLVLLVTLYQLTRPPGPAELLHASTGLWLAMGGGVALLLGGWTPGPRTRTAQASGWELGPSADFSAFPQYPTQTEA
jgi:hypothetical protein